MIITKILLATFSGLAEAAANRLLDEPAEDELREGLLNVAERLRLLLDASDDEDDLNRPAVESELVTAMMLVRSVSFSEEVWREVLRTVEDGEDPSQEAEGFAFRAMMLQSLEFSGLAIAGLAQAVDLGESILSAASAHDAMSRWLTRAERPESRQWLQGHVESLSDFFRDVADQCDIEVDVGFLTVEGEEPEPPRDTGYEYLEPPEFVGEHDESAEVAADREPESLSSLDQLAMMLRVDAKNLLRHYGL